MSENQSDISFLRIYMVVICCLSLDCRSCETVVIVKYNITMIWAEPSLIDYCKFQLLFRKNRVKVNVKKYSLETSASVF